MACTSPMIRIPTYEINPETGKHSGRLFSWSRYQQERGKNYKSFYDWKDHFMETHPEQKLYGAPQLIPCGKCASCRLSYSREWANRCMLELQDHKSAYFLTLTYDDDHLVDKNGDKWTKDSPRAPSLYKKHVSDFVRKIRDNTAQNPRFFLAGEYGTESLRPHYHVIMYDLIIPDLKFYKRSSLGDNYYTSEWLNKFWCNDMRSDPKPFGYIVIADVTWESCAYTARYCMKKRNGTEIWKLYEKMDVNPEFTNMSRRPGIGSSYYLRNGISIFDFDGINISTSLGGKKVPVPHYYKRIASRDYADYISRLSDMVIHDVEIAERSKLNQVSYDQDAYLRIQDQIINDKVKMLRRKEF